MPANEPHQIQQVLEQASERLKDISESPRLDAEILLAQVLGKTRSYLFTWPEKMLGSESYSRFEQLVQRRLQGEPVAYITGEREFWSLALKVSPHTLIPRPDTERLVELALETIPVDANWQILDLGTGSGAIALAIAIERPGCMVTAVDQSEAALQIAKENAEAHAIRNIVFLSGNWFEPVTGKHFHMIVSNPPYIASDDPHLQQGDVRFEPMSALVSGVSGMNDIEEIIKHAPAHLHAGGRILLEHGYQQADMVKEVLKKYGFETISTDQDLAGNNRVSGGSLPG